MLGRFNPYRSQLYIYIKALVSIGAGDCVVSCFKSGVGDW